MLITNEKLYFECYHVEKLLEVISKQRSELDDLKKKVGDFYRSKL